MNAAPRLFREDSPPPRRVYSWQPWAVSVLAALVLLAAGWYAAVGVHNAAVECRQAAEELRHERQEMEKERRLEAAARAEFLARVMGRFLDVEDMKRGDR